MIPTPNLTSNPDENYLNDNLLGDCLWTCDFDLELNYSISSMEGDQSQLDHENVSTLPQYDCIDSSLLGESNISLIQTDIQQDEYIAPLHEENEEVSVLTETASPITPFLLPVKPSIQLPKVPIGLKEKEDLSGNASTGNFTGNPLPNKTITTNYAQKQIWKNSIAADGLKPIIMPDALNTQGNIQSIIGQENSVPFPNPTLVKLENGHLYVATSIKKPKVNDNTIKNHTNLKSDMSRGNANVKIESLHTLSRDLNALKKYKRQQRMIKNRESACLSRQRKKEQLKSLEMRIIEITSMNENLKEENKSLKQRIESLEKENSHLRRKSVDNIGSKNNALKSSVFFIIILFFIFKGFRSSPDIFELSHKNELSLANKQLVYHSRSLLQLQQPGIKPPKMDIEYYLHADRKPYNANSMNEVYNNVHEDSGSLKISREKKTSHFHSSQGRQVTEVLESNVDCGEQFNETYLNRINNALNGLVTDHMKKELKLSKTHSKHKKQDNRGIEGSSLISKISKVKSNNCSHNTQHRSMHFMRNYKLEKVKKILAEKRQSQFNLTSQDLANAVRKSIERRADTFYVVTLWKDFLVLPRTNNSNSNRPKVSFIIPAFHRNDNDTFKTSNRLTMLQIDCNVIDAKLIELNQGTISRTLFTQVTT